MWDWSVVRAPSYNRSFGVSSLAVLENMIRTRNASLEILVDQGQRVRHLIEDVADALHLPAVLMIKEPWSKGALFCYNIAHRGPPRGRLQMSVW